MNKKLGGITVILVVIVIVIVAISSQPSNITPNVKFVNNQKFSEDIYQAIPKTMNFVVENKESIRYDDIKVIISIDNVDDTFLSIQPKEIIIEPLIGIEDSSERKNVTFTLHKIAQGGSLTYYGKSILYVNGIETDHKDIELRVPKQ